MTNDIDLSYDEEFVDIWIPIGTIDSPFKGNFDGNGYTVKNIYIIGIGDIGLFGFVDEGNISNLGIEDSLILGESHVGGIAGYINNSTIANSYNIATINGLSHIGGIVGYMSNNIVINSFNAGAINGVSNVGGIAGYTESNNIITNSYNTGMVSGFIVSGGIVGTACEDNIIANNHNIGSFTGERTGGIVGMIWNDNTIQFNYCLKNN